MVMFIVHVLATENYIHKWSCLLFMFLQLKFVYMFVEAEHEQICPCRYRRYVLAKGSDLEATTSGLCIAVIHRDLLCTLYANVKCLATDFGFQYVRHFLRHFEVLLAVELLTERFNFSFRFKEKRTGRATVPQIRFVFAEARNWVWQGVQQTTVKRFMN